MTDDTLPHRLAEALGPAYSIERELGGGGMSRVFVAVEQALGRRVVVKVLPPDLAAGVNIERFRREIQLAAQLQHPHIVPLLTAGDRDGLLWFTMPFIEGESLSARVARDGRLAVRTIVRILHDVVDALAYAHSRGVIHRDIKPGNILMSGSHAVVTDFGVAKALSASIPMAGHTTSGMAIGTPAYMAPEQLAADPAADHRVDLYAVGLVGYELLTGAAPFLRASPQATLAAQLTERPSPPRMLQDNVPPALSDLVMQCLEKEADRRPADARALALALDTIDDALAVAPAPEASEPPGVHQASDRTAPSGTHDRRTMATRGKTSRRRVAVLLALMLPVLGVLLLVKNRTSARALDARPTPTAARSIANATAPETVVVYRNGDVDQDGAEGTAVPLPMVLSRAESLAIARALIGGVATDVPARDRATPTAPLAAPVESPPVPDGGLVRLRGLRGTSASGPPGLTRDSLVAAISRIFVDSMNRAVARRDSTFATLPLQRDLLLQLRSVLQDAQFIASSEVEAALGAAGLWSTRDPGFEMRSELTRPPTGGSDLGRGPSVGDAGASARESSTRRIVVPLMAPPPPGTVRVVATPLHNGTGDVAFTAVAKALGDSVRNKLHNLAQTGVSNTAMSVQLVNETLTRQAAGSIRGRDAAMAIGYSLRAHFVVSGTLLQRGDSLLLLTSFTDVREGSGSRVYRQSASVDNPNALLAPTNTWLAARLDTLAQRRTRTPGRPAPPS